MTINVALNQRAVVFRDGMPWRALGPGRHFMWGRTGKTLYFDIDKLTFQAAPQVRAVIPSDWYTEVTIENDQRAVLSVDGRPSRYLRPGVHRYWTVDPSVELLLMATAEPPPVLTEQMLQVIPSTELVTVLVNQHQRGLLYVQGRFEGILDPGRHAFWTSVEQPVSVTVVDMRRQQLPMTGQELMTRDKVTLRLSLTTEWAPLDPAEHAHIAVDATGALYALVQLAVRDYVAGVTLDQLLEGRDGMTRFLLDRVKPEAEQIGVGVERIGVKDIILPGEMKSLLNRVIEAEQEATANIILRREEAAATRTMANAAQLMTDRPMLLRLKELETLKEVATNIDEIRVVVGADKLETLLPKTARAQDK